MQGSADQSWIVWWQEENGFFKSLSVSWKIVLFLQKSCLWAFVAFGLLGRRFPKDKEAQWRLVEVDRSAQCDHALHCTAHHTTHCKV